jgi:hypothetical protein
MVLFALLALVGYQTIQMDQLPSFNRLPATVGSSASVFARTGESPLRKSSRTSNTRVPIPLTVLTHSRALHPDKCNREDNKTWIDNRDAIASPNPVNQRIPFYIHQTSKSRCMHHYMASIVESKWRNLTQYNYFFMMMRLSGGY